MELAALDGEEPAPKRARQKLTEENSAPKSVSFKSAKGDISFAARKRAKQVEVAEPPPEAPSPPQRQQRVSTQAKAPPTPGLYALMDEHLSARGAERSQRWGQFLIA